MRRKFLPLLLLLLVSAILSTNIRHAAAQHQTNFIIDPCSACNITIANVTWSASYLNGTSASLENGPYNISAITTSGYTFGNWNYTAGITVQSNVTNPTNITLSGSGPSTLTLRLNAPVTTIQPMPIFILAIVTAALPVLLRRAKKPIGPV